jgi:hypothetical protein
MHFPAEETTHFPAEVISHAPGAARWSPIAATSTVAEPPFGAPSGPSGGHRLSVQMWLIWRLPASRR